MTWRKQYETWLQENWGAIHGGVVAALSEKNPYKRALQMAEDACQTAADRALQKERPFRGKQHFVRWVIRVALNCTIDALRDAAVRAAEDVTTSGDVAERGASPLDPWVAQLKPWIAELPPEDQAMIRLKHDEGLSEREIADVLGIPTEEDGEPLPDSTRISRVRRRLQRIYGELQAIARASELAQWEGIPEELEPTTEV